MRASSKIRISSSILNRKARLRRYFLPTAPIYVAVIGVSLRLVPRFLTFLLNFASPYPPGGCDNFAPAKLGTRISFPVNLRPLLTRLRWDQQGAGRLMVGIP